MFIGDSYNNGVFQLVWGKVNLQPHLVWRAGQTSHAFKDFLRDPGLLDGCRVVIWVNCNTALQHPWPLPQPVRDCLQGPGEE
jgi:hypothetical protein